MYVHTNIPQCKSYPLIHFSLGNSINFSWLSVSIIPLSTDGRGIDASRFIHNPRLRLGIPRYHHRTSQSLYEGDYDIRVSHICRERKARMDITLSRCEVVTKWASDGGRSCGPQDIRAGKIGGQPLSPVRTRGACRRRAAATWTWPPTTFHIYHRRQRAKRGK